VPTAQPIVVASATAPTNDATVLNLLFIKISRLSGGAGGESTVPGDILQQLMQSSIDKNGATSFLSEAAACRFTL
jgi:hypothetical protein